MYTFKIIPPTVIVSPLVIFSKKRLFEEISQRASFIINTGDRAIEPVTQKYILDRMIRRESNGSTAVTAGFAMPHAMVRRAKSSLAILSVLNTPVQYNTVNTERQMVDVVYSFFFPTSDDSTKCEAMLEQLADIMQDQGLIEAIRLARHDEAKLAFILNKIDQALVSELSKEKEQAS